jgi:uncharacterized protein (TIGR00251 family)
LSSVPIPGERDPTSLQIRVKDGYLLLKARVKPGAASDGLNGIREGALLISVKAPPVKGKANRHSARLLSRRLGLRGSAVTVARGETSRDKWFRVEGLSERELRDKIGELF